MFRDGPTAKRAKIEDPFEKAVTEAVKRAKVEVAELAQKAQDHDSSALSTSSSSTARTYSPSSSTDPDGTVWVRRVTGITPEAVASSSQSQEA